jgi:hypothetical protein
MRPLGQISTALLSAADKLAYEVGGQRRGPTLQEMAHHAQVGIQAARDAVHNLRRAGKLVPVAERKVDYRNRPVAEYAPKRKAEEAQDDAFFDVASVFAVWNR